MARKKAWWLVYFRDTFGDSDQVKVRAASMPEAIVKARKACPRFVKATHVEK